MVGVRENKIYMVKHFCDVCKKECSPILVTLPTINGDGVGQYQTGNKIRNRKHVSIRQFDVCDDCYGIIAMNVYAMTKIFVNDE